MEELVAWFSYTGKSLWVPEADWRSPHASLLVWGRPAHRLEETAADQLIEARARRKKRIWRVIQIVVSLAIGVGVFAFAIPKVANYSAVWDALRAMTSLELATLFAVMMLNIVSYWPQQTAAMPGLKLAQAAVVTQTSTSIANTMPGGGVVAVGVSYAMYHSWGFTNSRVALSVLVTGNLEHLHEAGASGRGSRAPRR